MFPKDRQCLRLRVFKFVGKRRKLESTGAKNCKVFVSYLKGIEKMRIKNLFRCPFQYLKFMGKLKNFLAH
jgi:hypothetical protein